MAGKFDHLTKGQLIQLLEKHDRQKPLGLDEFIVGRAIRDACPGDPHGEQRHVDEALRRGQLSGRDRPGDVELGQTTTAGSPTMASSLKLAIVSSVM
jgi:hypothetical protein